MARTIGGDLFVAVVGALVGAAALGVVGLAFGQSLAEGGEYLNPTCDHAAGLKPIPSTALRADGPAENDDYAAERALDGYTGSAWMPPTEGSGRKAERGYSKFVPVFSAVPAERTLAIHVDGDHDIRLVCVNNGLGSGDVRYENFGKVKTLRVWGAGPAGDRAKTAILVAMPTAQSQRAQEVADDLGRTDVVNLELVDAYSGSDVVSHDPNHCSRLIEEDDYKSVRNNQPVYEPGCIVAASPQAGISEVTLYERDQADPIPFPWNLWPGL